MRRSRPGELATSPQASPNQRPIQPEPPPAEQPMVLDWGLLSATPRCCVCREAYTPAPGEDVKNHAHSGLGPTRRPGHVGEESFVVLPDFTPVLSESYFSLSRTGASSPSGANMGETSPVGPAHTAHEMSFMSGASGLGGIGITGSGFVPVGGSRMPVTDPDFNPGESGAEPDLEGGSSPGPGAPNGFRVLDRSGYGSGFGGWTGSGFGTGSSLLESIVQISHAGLSDNVRRESLLHELSKRRSRPTFGAPDDDEPGAQKGIYAMAVDVNDNDQEHDSILCCHCYASLLERLDEDTRLAERDALAYRDFVELLDGISDVDEPPANTVAPSASSLDSNEASSVVSSSVSQGDEGNDQVMCEGVSRRQSGILADGDEEGPTTVESDERSGSVGENIMVDKDSGNTDVHKSGSQEDGSKRREEKPTDLSTPGTSNGNKDPTEKKAVRVLDDSPYTHALRVAQQTSMQLRKELGSLESQRGALCLRGSKTWSALAELAYARRVLGDECRELLRDSKEVAEAALDLSSRSALSDLFTIRHTKGSPSINGYRLGRAPDEKQQLRWNEINAAWGQAVLLVRCVSNAIGFQSKRFRLVPLNCASRVVELATGHAGIGGGEPQGGAESEANMPSPVVLFAHDLFSSGGSSRGDEKHRIPEAIKAFLACSTEVFSHLERRILERRLDGGGTSTAGGGWVGVGVGRGRNRGAARDGIPFQQTGESVGGVFISSLSSQKAWKSLLCQLVKNLEWAVSAGSSLCVT